jgi:HPt (histidine-containing phosphotransfer) domain-containing protein
MPIDPLHAIRHLDDLASQGTLEMVHEIIDIFVKEAPIKIEGMRVAATSHDGRRLEEGAHYLKSSCGYLGLITMQNLCFDLEVRGREGKWDGALEVATLLQTECLEAEKFLLMYKKRA